MAPETPRPPTPPCRTRVGTDDAAAARRDDRRQPRPHRRPRARPRGARRRARPGAAGPTPSSGAEVDRLARGLLGAGVGKGDRVGIWAPNCAEWVLVQYATAKIGAILVNINPAYRTHELEYVLNQSGVAVLVAAPSFKTSDYVAMIDEVRPRRAPGCEQVVLHRPGRRGTTLLARADAVSPERLTQRAGRRSSPDDPINIQYTSGTTGFPKGATLSHHNILNNGYFVGERLPLHRGTTGSASRCPSTTASAWSWATSAATTHGACMVIPAPGVRPGRDAARRGRGAVHLALRRADDVHRRAGRCPTSTSYDLSLAAHRDHGRLAVPGRGDDAARRRPA